MKCYHLGGNLYFDIKCAEALLISHNLLVCSIITVNASCISIFLYFFVSHGFIQLKYSLFMISVLMSKSMIPKKFYEKPKLREKDFCVAMREVCELFDQHRRLHLALLSCSFNVIYLSFYVSDLWTYS